ncbi:MAG: transglycosylase SLT domain-containing protein [Gammaproteobacteria bacterium]
MKSKSWSILSLAILSACANLPPQNPQNICEIFREKDAWYQATLTASRRWGIPIAVQMSIIKQESSFRADAEPPRPTVLGFIPWFRSSSAYGYPQAQDGTWSDYQQQSGNGWADREDFADSCDFVAWYCAISYRKLGIKPSDAHNLYLAYHEGHGGFQRQTYRNKQWLLKTAEMVDRLAWQYDAQLAGCRQELEAEN